jgi:hypothetical protein
LISLFNLRHYVWATEGEYVQYGDARWGGERRAGAAREGNDGAAAAEQDDAPFAADAKRKNKAKKAQDGLDSRITTPKRDPKDLKDRTRSLGGQQGTLATASTVFPTYSSHLPTLLS